MTTSVSKLEQVLNPTGNPQLAQRASLAVQQIQLAQEAKVNGIKRKLSQAEINLLNLQDLGPDSTFSTRPVDKGFNPEDFVNKVHAQSMEIVTLKIELEIAEKQFDSWFALVDKVQTNTTLPKAQPAQS